MFDIRRTMRIHALISLLLGLASILIPHRIMTRDELHYNHIAHEYLRLYGCLHLAVGWIVFQCSEFTDGRLLRCVSEAFSICYLTQAGVMIRAQFTNPSGHQLEHWIVALISFAVGMLYLIIRFFKKIKDFDLPRSI